MGFPRIKDRVLVEEVTRGESIFYNVRLESSGYGLATVHAEITPGIDEQGVDPSYILMLRKTPGEPKPFAAVPLDHPDSKSEIEKKVKGLMYAQAQDLAKTEARLRKIEFNPTLRLVDETPVRQTG